MVAHIEPDGAATCLVKPNITGACSVRQFCAANNISPAFYYVMKAEGWGPREMWAGSRVLISDESAADWRRKREAAAAAGVKRKFDAESELASPVAPPSGGRKLDFETGRKTRPARHGGPGRTTTRFEPRSKT